MAELKECPCCGSAAHMGAPNMHGMTHILCPSCGLESAWGTPDKVKALWNRRAQPANDHFVDVNKMIEQAAQDMNDKCRQWQCVLQRVYDAGAFDQNSGLWTGIDKEREAKAQASFEAYRYALEVIDKIAERVNKPYKPDNETLTLENGFDITNADGTPIDYDALGRKYKDKLCYCDIDGFYIGEDGQLVLMDDCGASVSVDRGDYHIEARKPEEDE